MWTSSPCVRRPCVTSAWPARWPGDDDEERELQLFASLVQVSRQDLEGLKLSDYQRLQHAYFRLVREDTDDELRADAPAGAATGD